MNPDYFIAMIMDPTSQCSHVSCRGEGMPTQSWAGRSRKQICLIHSSSHDHHRSHPAGWETERGGGQWWTPMHNNWILVSEANIGQILLDYDHWQTMRCYQWCCWLTNIYIFNTIHSLQLPVVNGPVYFIKNSSVFLHKSWESSAEELLVWFMGHHADFKASLLLGHRNDHVGPHSSQLTVLNTTKLSQLGFLTAESDCLYYLQSTDRR